MTDTIGQSWSFGELEASLAAAHAIADSKRTAFQARLKNFHRLGFPPGFSASKGRTSQYSAAHVYYMALALELAELGLAPEPTCQVLNENQFVVAKAARYACKEALPALESDNFWDGSPDGVYVYFDPNGLRGLNETATDEVSRSFFFGRGDVIAALVRRTNKIPIARLSLVNITSVLWIVGKKLGARFLTDLEKWSHARGLYSEITEEAWMRKMVVLFGLSQDELMPLIAEYLPRNGNS